MISSLYHLYPERIVELENQISDYFAKKPTSFFRYKNDSAIKKHVINKNPELKVSNYYKGNDDWLLTSRVIRVATYNVYYAHREKRIRDACMSTLALQLLHIPQQKLLDFLTKDNLSFDLINLMRDQLVDHLTPIFSEWKVKFSYWYVENMLRAVRNSICEKVPAEKFIDAATYICQDQQKQRQKVSNSIIKSFTVGTITQNNSKDLKNALVMKYKKAISSPKRNKRFFYNLWDEAITVTPITNYAQQFTGIKYLLASFIEKQLSENKEAYQWDKLAAWKKLKPKFTKYLHSLIPIFFTVAEKLDLPKLTSEALSLVGKKNYWQQNQNDGSNTISHKRSLFRQSNRIIPLMRSNLTYGEESPTIIQEFMEQFYRCILTSYCEKYVRQNSATILINDILTILKQQNSFKTNKPQFKGTGLSLAWGDKQLFNLDLPNKSLTLGLAKSSPRKTWWVTFKIHDPGNRLKSYHPRDWSYLNPTIQFKNSKYYLLIPFKKNITPKRAKSIKVPSKDKGKTTKRVRELIIGYDQGLRNWADVTIAYEEVLYEYISKETLKVGNYTPENPPPRPEAAKQAIFYNVSQSRWIKGTKEGTIRRHVLCRKYLHHYSLNDWQILVAKFDKKKGVFEKINSLKKQPQNLAFIGKGKLRYIRGRIAREQSIVDQLAKKALTSQASIQKFQKLNSKLERTRNKYSDTLQTITQSLAAKLRDITIYVDKEIKSSKKEYRDCYVRVQTEELKFHRNKPKRKVGNYLAHNQVAFFFRQLQTALNHLLWEYSLGLWVVNPSMSSQYCSHPQEIIARKGIRNKGAFHCDKGHVNNSDRNASQNLCLFPPLSIYPVKVG